MENKVMIEEGKAILKQNKDRIIQREIFSKKYITLSSVVGSNVATSFALLKMAFYDVKSQVELLHCKGLEFNPDTKKKRYNEYLDYITSDELRYLNKGLDEILNRIGRANDNFGGFPFMFNEIIEVGKKLRYDFFEEFGILPEQAPVENISVKKVKRCACQTKIESFSSRPKNKQNKVVENNAIIDDRVIEK